MSTGTSLIGRDLPIAELRRVARDAERGQPGVVIIEGHSGVGKSALARSFVDGLQGWRIARARLDPYDSVRPLGAVHALVEALDGTIDSASASMQEASVELFRALDALDQPVLLRVEDSQWLDSASEEVLSTIGRQMNHGRLIMLIEAQPAEFGLAARLRRVAQDEERGVYLRLAPLTDEDVRAFCRVRLQVDLGAGPVERLLAVTGGFPVYLDSLARRLEAGGRVARSLESAIVDLVQTYSRSDDLVAAEVRSELDGAAEPTKLAMLCTALAEGLAYEDLAAVLRELDVTTPSRWELSNQPLLVTDVDGKIRMRHGIVSACTIAEFDREPIRQARCALATVLGGERALTQRYLLAEGGRSPELAGELMFAASRALDQRRGDQACQWALWAARLDPELVLPSVLMYLESGRPEGLRDFEDQFQRLPGGVLSRAFDTLLTLERVSAGADLEAVTAGEIAGLEPMELLVVAHAVHQMSRVANSRGRYGEPERARHIVIQALDERAESLSRLLPEGDELVQRLHLGLASMSMCLQTWAAFEGLDQRQVGTLVARMQASLNELEGSPLAKSAVSIVAPLLAGTSFLACEYGSARSALAAAARYSDDNPAIALIVAVNAFQLDFYSGRWDQAHLRLRGTLTLTLGDREDVGALIATAMSAMIPLCRGEYETGMTALRRVHAQAGQAEYSAALGGAAVVAAWAAVAAQQPASQVVSALEPLWASPLGGTFASVPTAVILCRALLAEGERTKAVQLVKSLDDYEINAEVLEYVKAHCAGLLAAESGNRKGAQEFFDVASSLLRGMDDRPLRLFEVVLAEDTAALYTEDGRVDDAVAAELEKAVMLLRRLRADSWANALEATRTRLAPGQKEMFEPATAPALLSALTSRERDIALRVANGLSNREIADEDVVSVRTVEYHVSNILRKTSLHSRVDLRQHIRHELRLT